VASCSAALPTVPIELALREALEVGIGNESLHVHDQKDAGVSSGADTIFHARLLIVLLKQYYMTNDSIRGFRSRSHDSLESIRANPSNPFDP
jgi:hypothetical protein